PFTLSLHAALPIYNAIRQHLSKLERAGLVVRTQAPPQGPGRPRQLFQAHPDAITDWGTGGAYQRLSLMLMDMLRSGDPAVEVGRRAGRSTDPGDGKDPVDRLQDALTKGGFAPVLLRGEGRAGRSTDPGDGKDPVDRLEDALTKGGFAPVLIRGEGRAEFSLERCPFVAAAETDPDTVCSLHLGLAQGLAEQHGVVVETLERRNPRRAGCRLRFRLEAS